ncbi:MAG: hypothetical protein ACRC57_11930 [Sarcina sp.]
MEKISEIEFDKKVNVKVKNINYGFYNYEYIFMKAKEELGYKDFKVKNKKFFDFENRFISVIKEIYDLSNEMIFDFYVEYINNEVKNSICENLDIYEKKIFLEMLDSVDSNNRYFSTNNKNELELLIKLCTRELFFITFYFIEPDITIWGNYNMKLPIFLLNNDDKKICEKVISQNNLEIE